MLLPNNALHHHRSLAGWEHWGSAGTPKSAIEAWRVAEHVPARRRCRPAPEDANSVAIDSQLLLEIGLIFSLVWHKSQRIVKKHGSFAPADQKYGKLNRDANPTSDLTRSLRVKEQNACAYPSCGRRSNPAHGPEHDSDRARVPCCWSSGRWA